MFQVYNEVYVYIYTKGVTLIDPFVCGCTDKGYPFVEVGYGGSQLSKFGNQIAIQHISGLAHA